MKLIKDIISLSLQNRIPEVVGILSLTILSAFAEVISIGAILPVTTLILAPEQVSLFLLKFDYDFFNSRSQYEIQVLVLSLFVMSILLSIACRVYLVIVSNRFSFGCAAQMSNELMRLALSAEYRFHVGGRSNELLSMLTKAQILGQELISKIIIGFAAFILSIAIVIFLCFVNSQMTLILVPMIIIGYVIISFSFKGPLAKHSKIMPNSNDERIVTLTESIEGVRDVIILDLVNHYFQKFSRQNNRYFNSVAEAINIGAIPRFLMEGVALFGFGVATYFLYVFDAPAVEIISYVGVFAFSAQKLMPQAQSMYHCWSSIKAATVTLKDIQSLHVELKAMQTRKSLKIGFANDISIKNVTFRHANSDVNVFSNVSISIFKGETVAIVGPSGSGKSSLVDIIMYLNSPILGTVSVDGLLLTSEISHGWWQNISHVSQKAFVHGGTFLENICLISDEQLVDKVKLNKVLSVCDLVELVKTKSDGLNSKLGEAGSLVSGGQRQRIALARALYNNRSLLVLDEATSALDEVSEKKVLARIKEHFPSLTILIVTHRPSSLPKCDKIIQISTNSVTVCNPSHP